MRFITRWALVILFVQVLLQGCGSEQNRTFSVKGVIKSDSLDEDRLMIDHEEIPGYMDAMVMPFRVKDPSMVADLKNGHQISFVLNVSEDDSWIDQIKVLGFEAPPENVPAPVQVVNTNLTRHPLKEFGFTNQLNQVMRIKDFEGRAVAITFIFTRCPIPNYCPRLTKNFASAIEKLKADSDAPKNWHFLSVTIDPEFDTPEVLKAYGEKNGYDPNRWSFLTGPEEQIEALANQSGVTSGWEGPLLNHNFRTLIIDATGQLQMSFPTSGDLSDSIVTEIIKGAKAKPTDASRSDA